MRGILRGGTHFYLDLDGGGEFFCQCAPGLSVAGCKPGDQLTIHDATPPDNAGLPEGCTRAHVAKEISRA